MASGRPSLEFPATIGPYTTSSARLVEAFNGFYRQHQFPRPDPGSSENSMAGMDLTRVGIRHEEIVFCQLSPLHGITLDQEAKDAASIPRDACHYAWAYPAVVEGLILTAGSGEPEQAFLDNGGYVYFDARGDVVKTDCICPAPLGTPGLMFGRPQVLAKKVAETLTLQGRFQEITLDAYRCKGATHFAWIRPQEFAESVASQHGCFTFKFAGGAAKYFPVVDKPVYTPDLLEEDLDPTEAWVVLRSRLPEIETLLIFDKASSLEENLARSARDSRAAHSGAAVAVGREGDGDAAPRLAYGEWQGAPHQGTVSAPWIFHFELPGLGAP